MLDLHPVGGTFIPFFFQPKRPHFTLSAAVKTLNGSTPHAQRFANAASAQQQSPPAKSAAGTTAEYRSQRGEPEVAVSASTWHSCALMRSHVLAAPSHPAAELLLLAPPHRYTGQLLCLTYPMIGNYGVPDETVVDGPLSSLLPYPQVGVLLLCFSLPPSPLNSPPAWWVFSSAA